MSQNTVEVDPAALAAEAARAVAGAVPDPSLTGGEGGEPGAVDPGAPGLPELQSWRPLIEGLTPTVRMTVFAQWNIAPNMEREFVDSLAQSLDLLFPGGLEGKWAPLVRLLSCCAGIAFLNYTANGYKLPPLGLKKPDDKNPDASKPEKLAA